MSTRPKKISKTPKTAVKKLKASEPVVINVEALKQEIQKNALSNSNSDMGAFIRNNGLSSLTLKQYFDIQNKSCELGFASKSMDDYRLNSAKENPKLQHLFSTDTFHTLENIELFPMTSLNLKLDREITVSFNDDLPTLLQPGYLMNFPYNETNLRCGYIFNTGGVPITMEWCPLQINGSKYLFLVSTSKDADISEFSNSQSILTIIEYNKENALFRVNKNIIINAIIKELEFSFVSTDKLSLLSLTLSTGCVEVWKVDEGLLCKEDNSISKFNYYTINDSRKITFKIDQPNVMITTSSFTSADNICVATNTGLIALFSISNKRLLYMVSTRIPGITCLKSSFPDDENCDTFDLFISSCEPYAYIGNFPFFNERKSLSNTFRIEELCSNHREWTYAKSVAYVNTARSFLSVEIPGSIQRTAPRNKSEATRLKILNDGEINSFCCQNFYKNGLKQSGFMLVSGHTNGSLRLSNLFNTLSVFDKKHPFTLKLLQLHQMQDKSFKIDLSYSADKTGELPPSKDKQSQLTLSKFRTLRFSYDADIQPSKITMVENVLATSWGNGLVLIENLIY